MNQSTALDPEEIDGDVYVSPRYLAGSTFTGDPALEPLLTLGFDLRHDDLGNAYVTAPDHYVRLGYLPEGATTDCGGSTPTATASARPRGVSASTTPPPRSS